MRRIVLFGAAGLVIVALLSGGFLMWRSVHSHSTTTAAHTAAPSAPIAKVSHAPVVLPANAPKIGVGLDPDIIDPFAQRLAKVNSLAHKMIVTNAEYHDNDAGQRYFVAIVTSCQDLNKLWSIDRGALMAKVETPLRLKADFATFAFVESDSQGQWGVAACDGTT